VEECRLESFESGKGQVASYSEYSNEHSVSTKRRTLLKISDAWS